MNSNGSDVFTVLLPVKTKEGTKMVPVEAQCFNVREILQLKKEGGKKMEGNCLEGIEFVEVAA